MVNTHSLGTWPETNLKGLTLHLKGGQQTRISTSPTSQYSKNIYQNTLGHLQSAETK